MLMKVEKFQMKKPKKSLKNGLNRMDWTVFRGISQKKQKKLQRINYVFFPIQNQAVQIFVSRGKHR